MLNSNLLDKFKDLEGQSIFSNSNITEKFRKNYLTYLHAVNAVWLYQRRDTVKWYKNPCILLLFHGNNLLIEFNEKSRTINTFAQQNCLNVHFSIQDIRDIIGKLDSNKAHNDDFISTPTLKLRDKSISKPLNISEPSSNLVSHQNGKKPMPYHLTKK